jgi:cellulose synthase/poly-beta-1,6-N-acetylglucosamine synthase-like glycosyltransferase
VALLTAASLDRRAARQPVEGDPGRRRLVALVPAHDEEEAIATTLRSLNAVDYPAASWRVVVVADNCTDRTASTAAREGAEVIERVDPDRRGKGYALRHGITTILSEPDPPDGVLIVDADCKVSPNIASTVDRQLGLGATAIQVANVVANPCASTYSALRFAAFAAINGTRPRGRSALGVSAGLLGTGMAFRSDLLASRPWDAFGLAEDAAYHLGLVRDGGRVVFAPDARVESDVPPSFEAAETQQARWERGRSELVRTWLPRLLAAGVRRREAGPIATAVDLAMPPLSLVVLGTTATVVASLPLRSRAAFRLSFAALLGQAAYVVGSLQLAEAPSCVYRALGRVPILVAWQCRLALKNARGKVPADWIRTPRTQEQQAA